MTTTLAKLLEQKQQLIERLQGDLAQKSASRSSNC
jgi:hypothetical protein